MLRMKKTLNSSGFTLVELLTVLTIIAVLAGIGLVNFSGVQSKGRDSTRKSDLRALAQALEIYYQKNDSYINPAGGGPSDCANDMSNFYTNIRTYVANQKDLKDPQTGQNYCYIPVASGQSFRLYAKLENCSDKDIIDPGSCTANDWNYSVTSQDLTIALVPTAGPSPTTAPTSPPLSPTPTNAPTTAPTCTPETTQSFTVSASEDDGRVYRGGPTYPPTDIVFVSTASAFDLYAGRELNTVSLNYFIQNGMVRWDTSSIPDNATITSATFRGYVSGTNDNDNRSLTADWYTAWPIDTADYSEIPQTSANAGFDITSIVSNANNDFVLQNAAANVSKTGYTGLRFHISGGQPVGGYNTVQFRSFDQLTNPKPTLIVTYTGC